MARIKPQAMRFIAVILEPSRHWGEHGVIDLHRKTLICKCTDGIDADRIAACMNIQHREREAKQLAQAAEVEGENL